MGLLYDSRFRALDSSGNPLVAASLTVYDAGTTNLSDIYRDAAFGTPMSNPTSGVDDSDAGGWFPQIFAAAGSNFDVILKNAAGVTVQSYEDVSVLGSSSTGQEIDFGNARYKLSASGGILQLEAGDPAGDNSGGQIRIGGWAGTVADAIDLDGPVDTGGIFTENGKKLPGIVQTTSSSSGATTIIIALTNTPTGCRQYAIDLTNVNCTTTGNIALTFSTDNGSTYTSANHFSVYSQNRRAGATLSGSNGAATAVIGTIDAQMVSGEIALTVKTIAGTRIKAFGTIYGDDGGSAGNEANFTDFNAVTAVDASRCTHVKLTFPGTASATYRVRPQRGLGE